MKRAGEKSARQKFPAKFFLPKGCILRQIRYNNGITNAADGVTTSTYDNEGNDLYNSPIQVGGIDQKLSRHNVIVSLNFRF